MSNDKQQPAIQAKKEGSEESVEDIYLDRICAVCGERFGDHKGYGNNCPNPNKEADDNFYLETVFTLPAPRTEGKEDAVDYPTYEQAGGNKKWDDMTELEQAYYNIRKLHNALDVNKNTIKRVRENAAKPPVNGPRWVRCSEVMPTKSTIFIRHTDDPTRLDERFYISFHGLAERIAKYGINNLEYLDESPSQPLDGQEELWDEFMLHYESLSRMEENDWERNKNILKSQFTITKK